MHLHKAGRSRNRKRAAKPKRNKTETGGPSTIRTGAGAELSRERAAGGSGRRGSGRGPEFGAQQSTPAATGQRQTKTKCAPNATQGTGTGSENEMENASRRDREVPPGRPGVMGEEAGGREERIGFGIVGGCGGGTTGSQSSECWSMLAARRASVEQGQ